MTQKRNGRGTETPRIVANLYRTVQPRLFSDSIPSITISVIRRRAQEEAA